MSYEIKRLPLGFTAPLGETWAGFIRPGHAEAIRCTTCDGTGQNPELKQLQADFYDNPGCHDRWWWERDHDENGREIAGSRRIVGDCRRWSHRITQDEVDYLRSKDRLWAGATAEAVNAWDLHGTGHDGINSHYLIEHRARRLGIWGCCAKCRGESVVYRSAAHRRSVEGWKPKELPQGNGYGLWRTIDEGTPVSPVFASPEALAEWLAANYRQDGRFAAWQWMKLIEAGWAPSGVGGEGGFMSGLEATVGEPQGFSFEFDIPPIDFRVAHLRRRSMSRYGFLQGGY